MVLLSLEDGLDSLVIQGGIMCSFNRLRFIKVHYKKKHQSETARTGSEKSVPSGLISQVQEVTTWYKQIIEIGGNIYLMSEI